MTLLRIISPFFVLALLAFLPAGVCAQTYTMKEFMALRPQWDELEKSETTIRLEGRFAGGTGRSLRLEKCPLPFRPALKEFPSFEKDTRRLQVTGRLDHQSDEQFFRVFSVQKRRSDQEQYAIKRAAVDPADPEDWHALADWAGARGSFYDDEVLLAHAKEARRQGLSVERVQAAGDVDKLEALAGRASAQGNEAIAREIRHEALRLRWGKIRESSAAGEDLLVDPLVKRIRAVLPRSAEPIAKWPKTLAAAYADQPVATYNRGDATTHSMLDRLFLAEVLLADIQREAREDGSNGREIAAAIAAAVPERTALAESYRLRAMEYDLAHVKSATRAEVLELAERLKKRDRDADARRALKQWLAVRESAAKADGPAGMVSVAEDYLGLLGDREAAVRVLLAAAKANPDSEPVAAKLKELGFRRMGGDWLSPEELAARPVDPLTAAMRAGRVIPGMTSDQVRKTLGSPEHVARAASRTQIYIVWRYGAVSGLAVHFIRRTNTSTETGRVVGVMKWSRRR